MSAHRVARVAVTSPRSPRLKSGEVHKWLEQKRESSENDYFEARSTSFEELCDAYAGLRHIHKWRERSPGTRAVAQACEFSKHTEQALRTWLESLDAPATRIEGAQAQQAYNMHMWGQRRRFLR